jgi:hypothetical protein
MSNVIENVAAKTAVEKVVPNVTESVVEVVAPITETVTETTVKKGWWANSSKATKGLIIGSVLVLAALEVWYFGFRKKQDDEIIEEVINVIQSREQGLALELVGSLPANHPFMPFVAALAHKLNKK